MNASSIFTQRSPHRARFGFPSIVRLTKFDREGFRKSTLSSGQYASFHFASSEYAKCFRDLPKPDVRFLKETAVDFLDAFDKESWYEDPVRGTRSVVVITSRTTVISWVNSFQ